MIRGMAQAIRVGLIGYGLAGMAFHAPLIDTTPGLHLDAIVTGNPERQAAAARNHHGDGSERWRFHGHGNTNVGPPQGADPPPLPAATWPPLSRVPVALPRTFSCGLLDVERYNEARLSAKKEGSP